MCAPKRFEHINWGRPRFAGAMQRRPGHRSEPKPRLSTQKRRRWRPCSSPARRPPPQPSTEEQRRNAGVSSCVALKWVSRDHPQTAAIAAALGDQGVVHSLPTHGTSLFIERPAGLRLGRKGAWAAFSDPPEGHRHYFLRESKAGRAGAALCAAPPPHTQGRRF